MVRRIIGSLIRIATLSGGCAVLLWGCMAAVAQESTVVPTVGRAVPDVVPTSGDEDVLEIIWAFEVGDLMVCDGGPALALRHLQRKFGRQVRLTMVAVGEDPQLIQPFLKRERLNAQVIRLSAAEYSRDFGPAPLPSVYLAKQRFVLAVAQDSTWTDGVLLRTQGIEATAQAFLD